MQSTRGEITVEKVLKKKKTKGMVIGPGYLNQMESHHPRQVCEGENE